MTDIEVIYSVYPRKVARRKALLEIQRALTRLREGESGPPMGEVQAFEFMKDRVTRYAKSKAGNNGVYTPHGTTFFSQARYLDDPKEWGGSIVMTEEMVGPGEKLRRQLQGR